MENEKKEKPFILEIEEAQQETIAMVNKIMAEHNIPCYFYEPIIDKIHQSLIQAKQQEIAQLKSQEGK